MRGANARKIVVANFMCIFLLSWVICMSIMKIHLISYGDNRYESQKDFFLETASHSDFFYDIGIYGPEDIDHVFNEQFQTILNHQKGGGYWIWKPYFIKKVLDDLPDNDILIYCDAGCMINQHGNKRFKDYIEILNSSDKGSLAFELPHKEIEFTKWEVFDSLNCSAEIINSNQLMATVILLRKCSHASLLVEYWNSILYVKPLLFTDDKHPGFQDDEFIDHRHDQSIFSLVRKTYGSEILPDETYFLDFIREGQNYPFWAARLR